VEWRTESDAWRVEGGARCWTKGGVKGEGIKNPARGYSSCKLHMILEASSLSLHKRAGYSVWYLPFR
jgi:hypothetical protein